jgi:hypothetical protein
VFDLSSSGIFTQLGYVGYHDAGDRFEVLTTLTVINEMPPGV